MPLFAAALMAFAFVLYDNLDVTSLRGASAARAQARLAVGSALFGFLRANDPVPAYRLSASSKLPGVWYATGHGHLGLTQGPVTGRLLDQMMAGQPTEIPLAPYGLARFA